jgi:serine/threonine protein kinase
MRNGVEPHKLSGRAGRRRARPLWIVVGKVHRGGLVHKDIKPVNILMNDTTEEVKLTGFGIASPLPRERQSPAPPETIADTLAYMAPQQTGRMNRSIDSRRMVGNIDINRWRGPSAFLRYGLAGLAVPGATIIQHFGDNHFAVTPSYFCAVLLTAWFGGLGPGLFAIALSILALMFYFVPPTGTFVIDAAYAPSLVLFLLAALFVTWLSVRERDATKSLVYARGQLDLKIRELEKSNQALRRSEAYLTESQRISHTCSAAFNVTEILYFSDEACRMFGFDPLQGMPGHKAVWQRIHLDDLNKNPTARWNGQTRRINLPSCVFRKWRLC